MNPPGSTPEPGRAFVTDLGNLEAASGYAEFLRVPAMSLGVYTLRVGETDGQQPHAEDEVYLVLEGRGRIDLDGEPVDVSPGSVVFVPARMPHQFFDLTENLRVLVFFAPAETGAVPSETSDG